MEAKILEKLNENNVWILIDFFRERISKYFDDSKNGLECARLSTLMEKLYKKAFEYYKKGKVDPDDFENLANSFKNHFTLKIFFQGLLSELKRAEDKLSDNFSFYFGAFFNVRIFALIDFIFSSLKKLSKKTLAYSTFSKPTSLTP